MAPVVAADAGGVKPLRRPNSQIAVGLSLIPGLGQLYNGQPRKAAYFFLWTVCTLGPGILLIIAGQTVGHALLTQHLGALFLLVALVSVFAFLSLFLAGLYMWGSSAIDAWQSANALCAGDLELAARRRKFRL
jgi:TM2 domain-containing membrane protein YozV